MPNPGSNDTQILDTLHLSDAQWRELAGKLQQSTPPPADTTEKRRHKRVEYLGRIGIAVRTYEKDWAKFMVLTRDLSCSGLGFVHGGFLYTGSECRIVLKAKDEEILCVNGVVKRCRLIQGTLHDIGVEFSGPIDANLFVDSND